MMVIQTVLERSGVNPKVKFEASDHGDIVLAGLTRLRDMEQLFDVVLIVENQRLPVHRVVLASCSDYFRAMFTDGLMETRLDEIVLSGVTAAGMKNLIDFAYSSKIVIDSNNVEDVLSAANHIQIVPVIQACVDYLKTHLSIDNCVDMLNVAELFDLRKLRDYIYKYMAQNLHVFSTCFEFFKLTSMQLKVLLQSNYPVDCIESDVLSAVISWVTHHHGNNKDVAKSLLSCVNFCSVSVNNISNVHNAEDIFELLSEENCPRLESFRKDLYHCNPVEVPGLKNTRGFEDSLIVCGGFRPGKGMTNSIQVYRPGTGVMDHVTTVPHVEQCNFGLTVMENCLYVIGGCYNDDQMEEIVHSYGFRYSPATDTWTTIRPMQHDRCRFYLGTVNRKLLAVGGDPNSSFDANVASCEMYDPEQNVWIEASALPGNRMQHAGTVLGDFLYVSGGLSDSDGPLYQDFHRYESLTDTWNKLADMLSPRADHSMFSYKNKIYAVGGWYEDPDTRQRIMASNIDCYDIETDTWEVIDTSENPRLYAAYTLVGDELFIIGGWLNGQYQNKCKRIERYNLVTGEWSEEDKDSSEIWEHLTCNIYLPTCKPIAT